MANQKITLTDGTNTLYPKTYMTIRGVSMPYTISAGGQYSANLYTAINNDLPSGWTCIGIAGFSSNEVDVTFVACFYGNSNYSLQLRNVGTSTRTNSAYIRYLATPLI